MDKVFRRDEEWFCGANFKYSKYPKCFYLPLPAGVDGAAGVAGAA